MERYTWGNKYVASTSSRFNPYFDKQHSKHYVHRDAKVEIKINLVEVPVTCFLTFHIRYFPFNIFKSSLYVCTEILIFLNTDSEYIIFVHNFSLLVHHMATCI